MYLLIMHELFYMLGRVEWIHDGLGIGQLVLLVSLEQLPSRLYRELKQPREALTINDHLQFVVRCEIELNLLGSVFF